MAVTQLELFSDDEFSDEETQIKLKAKMYAANSIFKCSGGRGEIRRCLEIGDKNGAFKAFNECFTNFGFGHQEYSFGAYGGKGTIKAHGNFEFDVTSKELFNVLLEMYRVDELNTEAKGVDSIEQSPIESQETPD
jgi:hypothetical protein